MPELGLDARFIAEAVDRADGNRSTPRCCASTWPACRRSGATWRTFRPVSQVCSREPGDGCGADPVVVEGLGVLCAAREALTLDELQAVTGWAGEAQRDAFKRTALEVLIETRRTEAVREYRLHHDSIRAYVADALGAVDIRRHHRALAQRLASGRRPRMLPRADTRCATRYCIARRRATGLTPGASPRTCPSWRRSVAGSACTTPRPTWRGRGAWRTFRRPGEGAVSNGGFERIRARSHDRHVDRRDNECISPDVDIAMAGHRGPDCAP